MSEPSRSTQPLDDDQIDLLAVLLHEFISATSFYSKQRLVEGNEILLSNEADSALAMLILEYDQSTLLRESLVLHRHLLQRSREVGIPDAFLELRQTLQDAPLSDSIEEAQTSILVYTIGEFITADNWEESRRFLDNHPELLQAEVPNIFDRLIKTHTARGERNVVRQLVVHRDLLRACWELGIDQAFERVMNPPETLEMLVDNTISVLTSRPTSRKEWQEIVNLSRIRAAETSDEPMLAFLRAISRLLDGESPSDIAPVLTPDYHSGWQRITAAVTEEPSPPGDTRTH
nr:hypothetical protein [Anaerolineae bacterium]